MWKVYPRYMASLDRVILSVEVATSEREAAQKALQTADETVLRPLREALKSAEVAERRAMETFDRAVLDVRNSALGSTRSK